MRKLSADLKKPAAKIMIYEKKKKRNVTINK